MARDKKRIETILKHVFAGAGVPLVGVSYERVSSSGQVSGTSLETQPLDIQQWAERHSIHIVKHYVDRGRSGRSADRAAYQQMLAELAETKAQVVLVWKLDRFARNMLLQLQKIEEFNALGVALVSITEMIDYTTAMGKQMLAQSAMYAQAYSDQLGERMERALRHTAEQGYWVGPVPLGYARQGKRQPLAPTADAATVEAIFTRYATGKWSDTTLADWLNREGHTGLDWRTGQRIPFTREGVRHILNNRAYLGYVKSGGNVFQGNHPPLVAQALWERCQTLRQRRSVDNTMVHRHDDGLLQGIASCEHCGASLWLHTASVRAKAYRYYRCSSVRDAACDAGMSPVDVIDAQVLEMLHTIQYSDALIEQAIAIVKTDQPQSSRPLPDPVALATQRERLNKLYVMGRLTDVQYEAQYAALELAPAAAAAPAVDIDTAVALLRDIPRLIQEATPGEQKQIVNIVFDRVWLSKRTIAAITPHKVFLTLLTAMKAANCVTGVADGRQGRRTHITYYQFRPDGLWSVA